MQLYPYAIFRTVTQTHHSISPPEKYTLRVYNIYLLLYEYLYRKQLHYL